LNERQNLIIVFLYLGLQLFCHSYKVLEIEIVFFRKRFHCHIHREGCTALYRWASDQMAFHL